MLRSLILRTIKSQFIVYLLRCIIGFLIGWVLINKFTEFDLFWVLLSIILVISPEENQAKQLTIDRFKSNFLGSISGLAVYFIPLDNIYKVILGIILTGILCRIFSLLNVARSAVVALLIIVIEQDGNYMAPVIRFSTTAIGCFIGLGVTLVTSTLIQDINKNLSKE